MEVQATGPLIPHLHMVKFAITDTILKQNARLRGGGEKQLCGPHVWHQTRFVLLAQDAILNSLKETVGDNSGWKLKKQGSHSGFCSKILSRAGGGNQHYGACETPFISSHCDSFGSIRERIPKPVYMLVPR